MISFEHILLATDFSDRALCAESRICMLDNKPESVQLLHVALTSKLAGLQKMLQGQKEVPGDADSSTLLMQRAEKLQAKSGIKVEVQLESGRAFELINEMAEAKNCMIVIGAHEHHQVRDWLQGSMVERLLDVSRQPLLVVKQPALAPYRSVLVPVDFSPSSSGALQSAVQIAPNAEIILFHVFQMPFEHTPPFPGVTEAELEDYQSAAREKAELQMAAFIGSFPELDTRVIIRFAHGDVATEILLEAERIGADLIVAGRYGNSGVEQLLLGSVTEYVVMESTCDMLVVNQG